MSGRSDKVEHGVDSIIPEARISLNARLLRKLIVVLLFQVAGNLREAEMALSVLLTASYRDRVNSRYFSPRLVINIVSEAGRVDDGEGDAGTIL